MKVYVSDRFVLPLPEGHRFPMAKYARLDARVRAHADALSLELIEAPAASRDDLLRVHDAGYVARVLDGALDAAELRRIGFPWSPQLLERTRRVSGASAAALEAAIADAAIAVTLAGGTHHAAFDRGGGYCVFNDAMVAARRAQALGLCARVLIVDLDVHQGDGTASLAAEDPSIYTFSIHAARNYPAIKPASDRDVALPDGTDDAGYLAALDDHLDAVFDAAAADAVIYLAGADPYFGDRLGHLALTKAGLLARDQRVIDACRARGLPLAIAMAGGYADSVDDIVDIHFATVTAAARAADS